MKQTNLILKFFLVLMISLSLGAFAAEKKVIRVNDAKDVASGYAIQMIKLALEHIDNKYTLEIREEKMTQARVFEEVKTQGALDLMWSSANAQKEQDFSPVRIPLFKGIVGYRILIIRKGDQARFENIHSIEDLKTLTFGQGKTWADTKILQANGLNVTKVVKNASLYYMLDGGRFDAFPRGPHEPFGEIAKYPNLNLVVEKNLILAYKMDSYLFAAKENLALAKDLELGLNRAIADGSFDKAFYSAPAVKDVIEKADMSHRRIIYLENPTLSKETPIDRKELWIDPKSL